MRWLGSPAGDAWFAFFTWRCAPPAHWEPAFVRGPEWMSEDAGERYGPDLTYYAGFTDEPAIVDTWRARPGGQWESLGWSTGTCHTGARPV